MVQPMKKGEKANEAGVLSLFEPQLGRLARRRKPQNYQPFRIENMTTDIQPPLVADVVA